MLVSGQDPINLYGSLLVIDRLKFLRAKRIVKCRMKTLKQNVEGCEYVINEEQDHLWLN